MLFENQPAKKSMTTESATLSWDELFQVLLFLPVSDVCHYSQTNSLTYGCITSNQHLWSVLLKRDFGDFLEILQSSLTVIEEDTTKIPFGGGCDELRDYTCYYARFCRFPFNLVESYSMFNDQNNCTVSKVAFGVVSSQLNLSVLSILRDRQLKKQHDDSCHTMIGVDFKVMYMASKEPTKTSNFALQFWIPGRGVELSQRIARGFYRGTQCLVIAVDPRHAWDECSYSTSLPYSNKGTNSMSRALTALKESKPHLKLEPPEACKGVLIVGVGAWPKDAPISKQRFLKDCAQVFDILPLEYCEVTSSNVTVMSDLILRRLYTFHQWAALDGDNLPPPKPTQQAPTSRCILS